MKVTPRMKMFVQELHQKHKVKQSVESILQAACEYFNQTEEGSDQVIFEATSSVRNTDKLMSALATDQTIGSIEKIYSIVDNGHEISFKSNDVVFFSGVLLEGRPYPQRSMYVDEVQEEPCESCGGLVPCAEIVSRGPGVDPEVYCNHCRMYSENAAIKQSADHSVCGACTKVACAHNPRNSNNIKLLPARCGS